MRPNDSDDGLAFWRGCLHSLPFSLLVWGAVALWLWGCHSETRLERDRRRLIEWEVHTYEVLSNSDDPGMASYYGEPANEAMSNEELLHHSEVKIERLKELQRSHCGELTEETSL